MSKYKPENDLSKHRLIKEYYNYLKPDMDFYEFLQVCETPFRHLKHTMSDGNLREFVIPYMGKFIIPPGYIIKALKVTENRYAKNNIDESEYKDYIDMLTSHIKRHPEKFKKYKEELKKWIYL